MMRKILCFLCIYLCVWQCFRILKNLSLEKPEFNFFRIVSSACMTRQITDDENYSNHVHNKSESKLIFFYLAFL